MENYERLLTISTGIYNLFLKFSEKEEEKYELYNSLLRDLYAEEDSFLGNMRESEFQELMNYMEKTYDFTFEQSLYEVVFQKNLELPLLRTYERVKEEYDRRKFTSLSVRELNSFVDNKLIRKIKEAYTSIQLLDLHVSCLAPKSLSVINSYKNKLDAIIASVFDFVHNPFWENEKIAF